MKTLSINVNDWKLNSNMLCGIQTTGNILIVDIFFTSKVYGLIINRIIHIEKQGWNSKIYEKKNI